MKKCLIFILFLLSFVNLAYSQELPQTPTVQVQKAEKESHKLINIGFFASEAVMYGSVFLDGEMTRRNVGHCALEGNPAYALPPFDSHGNGYNFNAKKFYLQNLAISGAITVVHVIIRKKTSDKIGNLVIDSGVGVSRLPNLLSGIKWVKLCN